MNTSRSKTPASLSITKKQARRFLLLKQLLFRPRAELTGSAGIDTVFRRLGAIQFDPLSPCGNNVDLVLQSRVRDIKKSDYHEWVYEKRQGIEIRHKELCIVPVEKANLTRRYLTRTWIERMNTFVEQNKTDLAKLKGYVKENGPISAQDIKDERKLNSGWGSSSSWGRVALDVLWQVGELSVVKRHKNRKWYDLTARAYGLNIKNNYQFNMAPLNTEQVLGRIDNVGLLPASGTGAGWLRMGTGKDIKPVLRRLAKNGDLKYVTIEGVKREYVIQEKDILLLDKARNVRIKDKISFIAPLDNLLWDRVTIKEIFNFDYRWEVYTPVHKRKYGYYVLPILFGDRFIGRIEPVVNPGKNVLEIKGFWLEDETVWTPLLRKRIDEYLEHFLSYLDVRDIIWKAPLPEEGKK